MCPNVIEKCLVSFNAVVTISFARRGGKPRKDCVTDSRRISFVNHVDDPEWASVSVL